MTSEYIIEMTDILKEFGPVKAIENGQFNLKKGEIHSLIGENGAGKSTMMNILYGLFPQTDGQVSVHGKPIDPQRYHTKDAISMGIGMVHQEFMLVDELTVLENILLGFEPRKGMRIDFEQARKDVSKYIEDYHMDIQLNKRINQISVGEAQRVEIIKTLYRGADIIILDEPTAVLTPQECDKFFEILNELKAGGKSIIFISHKLIEVMKISDRITVMRQGKFIDSVNKEDTNVDQLAHMMVGREVFLQSLTKNKTIPGKKLLEVDELWTSGEKELSKIRGVSFSLHGGEIVGIAGVDGNGQSELIEAITGLRKVEKGSVKLLGKDITNQTVRNIRKQGLAHIPEDRNARGLNRQMSITDNLVACEVDQAPYAKGIVREYKPAKQMAERLIKAFDIRPSNPEALTSALSGGNAQKVVVAREVDQDCDVLIAAQPSRGVDIGAIELIRETLDREKERGKGILLVSTDLEEILSLSDRIIVMYEGKITGILNADEAEAANLGLLMLGGSIKDAEAGGRA